MLRPEAVIGEVCALTNGSLLDMGNQTKLPARKAMVAIELLLERTPIPQVKHGCPPRVTGILHLAK